MALFLLLIPAVVAANRLRRDQSFQSCERHIRLHDFPKLQEIYAKAVLEFKHGGYKKTKLTTECDKENSNGESQLHPVNFISRFSASSSQHPWGLISCPTYALQYTRSYSGSVSRRTSSSSQVWSSSPQGLRWSVC